MLGWVEEKGTKVKFQEQTAGGRAVQRLESLAHAVNYHYYKSSNFFQKLWKAIEGFSVEGRYEPISLLESSLRQHCAKRFEGD